MYFRRYADVDFAFEVSFKKKLIRGQTIQMVIRLCQLPYDHLLADPYTVILLIYLKIIG